MAHFQLKYPMNFVKKSPKVVWLTENYVAVTSHHGNQKMVFIR